MTVKELFIEMLKLILKGKGNYHIYADDWAGWIGGVMSVTEENDRMKRVQLW